MTECFMCKGNLENKLTTFMVDLDSCIVIVKNVPSQVCSQCGEVPTPPRLPNVWNKSLTA